MKITTASALILTLLTTIATSPARAQEENFKYQCEDGKTFEVFVRPDKARLKLDAKTTLKLLPLDAREGLKFAANRTLLTMVNKDASIAINDRSVYSNCVAQ
ncbi:hypothetical protein JOY44_18810 [Phormidium sp. CLA17]|uniref:hypothetical protein n=1 Tax=Leptolyngbya sp. Cla-17 TaxID=2803751 RepID=UPI001490A598|nr:hypothetical protein [Leptolyngbya sp. Cla-17]MBM0743641.1 hypothetical protein [Leptolyngbya sp. Cla-17]